MIAGTNNSKQQLLTNNDTPTPNFDNTTVIDGYAGSAIEKYVKYIDGYNLDVDYYSSIMGTTTENTLLDVNNNSQQYVLVKQLTLKISTAIPTGSNYADLTIDAVLDANIVPANNDIVVVNLPSGLVGLFAVTVNDKKTYINRKIYDISLKLLYFKRDNPEYYNNLISKVKKTYIYDKSFITTNSSPIILENTYKNKIEIHNLFNALLAEYLELFVSEKVLSVNMGNGRLFDYNIQSILLALIDNNMYNNLKIVESSLSKKTIVSSILDKNMLSTPISKYYSHSLVKYDIAVSHTISLVSANITYVLHITDTVTPVVPSNLIASDIIPNNYRTSTDNLYLFSQSFYNENVGLDELSTLETNLLRYMRNELVSYDDLKVVVNDISNWNELEKFYYIPFTLLLLNYFTLNTYDRI